MTSQCKRWQSLSITTVLVVSAAVGQSKAQTILIDNFNDGNDDGWTRIDSTVGQPWGPGTFDATSGAFHLEGADLVPVGVPGGGFLASIWDASSDPVYSNGFLRAKVRSGTEGTVVSLFLRLSGSLQTGFNGYLLGATAPVTRTGFFFNKIEANEVTRGMSVNPDEFPVRFGVNEDWILEAGAIDDEITLKVWRPGEPEPDEPQLVVYDTTFAEGSFAVETNINTRPFPEPARVNASFDDIYFTFPHTLLPGDFDGDQVLAATDIDLLTKALRSPDPDPLFDLNGDGTVTADDHRFWVVSLRKTYFGDANMDGEFNSQDLVAVFQAGQYEDANAANSTWATGDWNGDLEFDSADFVIAFQDGGFERGPRAAASSVPEPRSLALLAAAVVTVVVCRRRKPMVR